MKNSSTKADTVFRTYINEITAMYVQDISNKQIQKKLKLDHHMSYQWFCHCMRKYIIGPKKQSYLFKLSTKMKNLEPHEPHTQTYREEDNVRLVQENLALTKEVLRMQKELYKLRSLSEECSDENSNDNSSVNELASLLSKLIDQKATDRNISSFEDMRPQDDNPDERNDDKEVRKNANINPVDMTSEQKLKLTEKLSSEEKFHFSRKYLNLQEYKMMRENMTSLENSDFSYERSKYKIEQEEKENSH